MATGRYVGGGDDKKANLLNLSDKNPDEPFLQSVVNGSETKDNEKQQLQQQQQHPQQHGKTTAVVKPVRKRSLVSTTPPSPRHSNHGGGEDAPSSPSPERPVAGDNNHDYYDGGALERDSLLLSPTAAIRQGGGAPTGGQEGPGGGAGGCPCEKLGGVLARQQQPSSDWSGDEKRIPRRIGTTVFCSTPPFLATDTFPGSRKRKLQGLGSTGYCPLFLISPLPLDQRRSGFFVPSPQFPSFPTSLNRRWRRRRGREGRHSPMKLGNDPFLSAMHEDEKNISQIFLENMVNAWPSPPAINFSITSPHPSSRS